ncbi:ABC transporter permease [Streptomyces sp. NPDC096176]|uniref:ABC transporter permease n=1 Tax=Streptomyces sp. NPDC096176 TaxID=3366079 RepID=UPI00380C20E8
MNTYRLTPARVLRSEWHKLWTLRSTWITLLTASSLTLGIGLLMGGTYESGGGDGDVDTVVLTLIGLQLAQIAFAVLGVLVTAGEYSTGMIRASMTTVPHRLPVLWSKAAVFAAVTFTVSLVTAFVTFPAAQLLFAGTDQEASLGDPGVFRALVGSSTGLTLLGLIALGLGALLRSVPGAIGAFIGGVMVLPEVVTMIPSDVVADAVEYFPVNALEALTSAEAVPGAASPGAALLALTLWAAGALAVAGAMLRRRDV